MVPNEALSTVQEINEPLLDQKKVRLLIKRDDLIHPEISGNKWRKIKYNLEAAKTLGHTTILTFGGAFSNHILAVASAGEEFGFNTIGIIRGEKSYQSNPTLSLAAKKGMKLHFVSRQDFRRKNESDFIQNLNLEFGEFYTIPEGGSNCEAIKGCQEIVTSIEEPYDALCCSVGTGGTVAGLLSSVSSKRQVIGFSALKGDFLRGDIEVLLKMCGTKIETNWELNTDYHFGGYAKFNEALIRFIKAFYMKHKIPLDPIYTGKLLYGIFDLIAKDHFNTGSTILALHSGGLQGIRGFNILHDQTLAFE